MLTAVIGVYTIPAITGLTALHWGKLGGVMTSAIGYMALILAGIAGTWLSVRCIRGNTGPEIPTTTHQPNE